MLRSLTTAAVGLLLVLGLAACGGTGSSPSGAASSAQASSAPPASDGGAGAGCTVAEGPGDVQAAATGFAFDPATVTAAVGQTITWTNGDSAPHTVTLDDGSCDSGQFGNGESVSLTFGTAGSYPYTCTIHPTMKGTIEITG